LAGDAVRPVKSLRKESEKPVVRAFWIAHGRGDFQVDEAEGELELCAFC
jgi:hypothetical protein